MNKCKFRIVTLVLGVTIFLCACSKIPEIYAKIDIIGENIENILENHEKKIFSDEAVRYKFDADNLLKLKEIIIDKDVLAYDFDEGSELIHFIKIDKDIKTWINNKKTDTLKAVDHWEVIDNKAGHLLVIYCNTGEVDFKYGVKFSNCYEEDGYSIDFGRASMNIYFIKNIENPVLKIDNIKCEIFNQRYTDGKWSEIEVEYYSDALF